MTTNLDFKVTTFDVKYLENGTRVKVKVKGGATVLKVGGQFCERSEPKNFLTPHFLASGGGDKILLR